MISNSSKYGVLRVADGFKNVTRHLNARGHHTGLLVSGYACTNGSLPPPERAAQTRNHHWLSTRCGLTMSKCVSSLVPELIHPESKLLATSAASTLLPHPVPSAEQYQNKNIDPRYRRNPNFWLLPSITSPCAMSSVDPQVTARHEAACVTEQKNRGTSVLLRGAETVEHVVLCPFCSPFWVLFE